MAFSADLRSFVKEQIGSVWALEVLLFLRTHRTTSWTADAVVKELRASHALIETLLPKFEQLGLVIAEHGAYRYAPAVPLLEHLCDQAEAAYRERPVAMITLIAQPPDPLQQLADAFRLRRGDS